MPARPEEIRSDALRAVQDAAGEALRVERYVARRDLWRSAGASVLAFIAGSDAGRSHLARDLALYSWAEGEGIPVPPLLARDLDIGYIVVKRVRVDPSRGSEYVIASVALADKIARASWPDAALLRTAPRREPRWVSAPLRSARMRAIPLGRQEVASVRRRFRSLPATAIGHGDFHHNNVLFDSKRSCVHLIDLEFVGPAPPGLDLATMWGSLVLLDDRAHLIDLLLEGADPKEADRLGLILHWVAIRYLLELFTRSPRHSWDDTRLKRALAVLDEAREVDRGWLR